MSDDFRDLITGIVNDSVVNGSGAPAIRREPFRVCPCWTELALHDGHCCFGREEYPLYWRLPDPLPPLPCGHEPEGQQLMAAYVASRLDEEPVEGDEQWIPHDELTEPEQDGWL